MHTKPNSDVSETLGGYEVNIPVIDMNNSPDDYNEIQLLIEQTRVTFEDTISEPDNVIAIIEDDGERRFATAGNFTLIKGKQKSKKTTLMAMFIAGYFGAFSNKIKGYNIEGSACVWFDTEQDRFDVRRHMDTIERLCYRQPNINVHALRSLSHDRRLALIEGVLESDNKIRLVIIDGIRDLVTSINDEEQATHITSLLMKWTEIYNLHIITVLHQNKSDLNARGHVGTELENKAETVISVAKDNANPTVSVVSSEYSRGREFNGFAFSVDVTGLPSLLEGYLGQAAEKNKKRTKYPADFDETAHLKILKEAFKNNEELKPIELYNNLKLAFSNQGSDIAENKMRLFITHYENKGFIFKPGNKHSPKAKYVLSAFKN